MVKPLTGVVAVLVTPFDGKETIVHEDIAREVEAAIAFGIGGVCLPAYASEYYKLSEVELLDVVRTAVEAANGRIPVVGQSNHPSARHAVNAVRKNVDSGVDIISFALPRQFEVPKADLLGYCETICRAIDVPVLIQDFNPGGGTVGSEFCQQLHAACDNFQYIKLEEPLLGPKLRAIREATKGQVRVLEGWGGMYLPELFAEGVSGVMPGLGYADVMQRLWDLGKADDLEGALDIFDSLLAQIVFSLQNLEFYLAVEKDLLAKRGITRHTAVRSLGMMTDPAMMDHARRLNERVLKLVDRLELPRLPLG